MRFGQASTPKTLGLVLLLALLCLCIIFIFYSGPFSIFDDSIYLGMVKAMLAGNYNPGLNPPFSLEFLTIAFLALSFKLAGFSLLSIAAPGALAFTGTVILVFLTGRKLLGDAFGMVAAVLAATTPFFLGFATRVLPDMGLAFFCTLSLYLIAAGREKPAYYFAGGFVGGLAPLVKTEGLAFSMALFLALAVTLISFWKSDGRKAHRRSGASENRFARKIRKASLGGRPEIFALLSLLVGMCVFFAFFYHYMGDPFYSITNYGQIAARTSYPNFTDELGRIGTIYYPYTYASEFQAEFSGPGTVLWNPQPIYPTGLLFDLAVIGALLALITGAELTKTRARQACTVALLFVFAMLYMNLGSESVSAYQPMQLSPRILSFLIAPAAIMAAYLICFVHTGLNGRRRRLGHVATCLILLSVFILNIPLYAVFYGANAEIRSVAAAYESAAQLILSSTGGGQGNPVLYLSLKNGLQAGVLDALLHYGTNLKIVPNAALACGAPAGNDTFLLISDDPQNAQSDYSAASSACHASLVGAYGGGYVNTTLYRISAR